MYLIIDICAEDETTDSEAKNLIETYRECFPENSKIVIDKYLGES